MDKADGLEKAREKWWKEHLIMGLHPKYIKNWKKIRYQKNNLVTKQGTYLNIIFKRGMSNDEAFYKMFDILNHQKNTNQIYFEILLYTPQKSNKTTDGSFYWKRTQSRVSSHTTQKGVQFLRKMTIELSPHQLYTLLQILKASYCSDTNSCSLFLKSQLLEMENNLDVI